MVREFLGKSGFLKNFIYFWLYCVFVAVLAFLQLWQEGATFSCGAQVALLWLLLLQSTGSVAVTHGLNSCGFQTLEYRPDSCGAWA